MEIRMRPVSSSHRPGKRSLCPGFQPYHGGETMMRHFSQSEEYWPASRHYSRLSVCRTDLRPPDMAASAAAWEVCLRGLRGLQNLLLQRRPSVHAEPRL